MRGVGWGGLWGAGRQSFERKLSIRVGLTLFCTVLLALAAIAPTALDFLQARQNLSDIRQHRLILDTADLIAAERGPANSVMAEEPSADSAGARRLMETRRGVDAALAQLDKASVLPVGVHGHVIPPQFRTQVRDQLVLARAKVDRLAARPRAALKQDEFQDAVESMFEASNRFRDIVTWSASGLAQHESILSGPVHVGQMLSDLRDQGGRMASRIMPAVATNGELPLQSVIDCRLIQGRLFQLWQGIRSFPASHDNPLLLARSKAIEHDFFGAGVKLVDDLIIEGRRGAGYSLTAADLTARFVPTMQPIEAYRRALLDLMVTRYEHARNAAFGKLAVATLVTAAIISILIGLLLSIRAHVFRPLLDVHDAVVGLADEQPGPFARHTSQAGEVIRLFRAIETLRHRLVERAAVTSQLRVQAETDGLTELFNRRTLDRLAQSSLGPNGKDDVTSLILMDIDHFKTINDTYGHASGDRVLIQLARLLRSLLRSRDVVARFGGEEFAILFQGVDLPGAIKIARKIRVAVQRERFSTTDGVPLRVTASFGVAEAHSGDAHWQHLIENADTALYRAKSDGRNRVRFTRGTRK